MAGLDRALVEHALETARKAGYLEVEVESGESRFHARLTPKPKAKGAASAATLDTAECASGDTALTIRAGLVGYFQPGKKPIRVGDEIEIGQAVGIIEALGIASDVESRVSGEVCEILVEAGQPVEFGQPLFRVQP